MKTVKQDWRFLGGLAFLVLALIAGRSINRINDADTFPNIKHTRNYVANPDFERGNVLDWTASSGTISLASSQASADRLNGRGWASFTPGGINATAKGDLRSTDGGVNLSATNCQAEVRYNYAKSGSSGENGWEFYFEDSGAANVSGTAVLPATYDALAGTLPAPRIAHLFFPCSKLSGGKPVLKYVNGSASDILYDDVVVGPAWSIGAGVPPNTFTAHLGVSGATRQTPSDWVDCTLTGSSGSTGYSCTYKAAMSSLTSVPNCEFKVNDGSGTVNEDRATGITTTGLGVFSNTTTTFTRLAGILTCTKTGSDYIQPAITPNQWNYGPRPYTPTFTGFGTVTNIECFESRDGAFNIIDCKFTSGTATAVEARVSLPSGNVSASTTFIPSIRGAGVGYFGAPTGTTWSFSPLIEPNVSYLTFGRQTAGASTLGKANGDSLAASGNTLAFTAKVQIAGWTENQGAPQLVGSVTTDESNLFHVGAGVTNTSCGSTPCGLLWIHGLTSVTRSGTGAYTINAAAGKCAKELACSVNSNGARTVKGTASTTAYSFSVLDGSGVAGDGSFSFNCSCPKQ